MGKAARHPRENEPLRGRMFLVLGYGKLEHGTLRK
jgi:hypothetical protein